MTQCLNRPSPPSALAADQMAPDPHHRTSTAKAAGRQPIPGLTVHGTAIAWQGKGLLLLGPSGSGKSDLALRLLDSGAMLVADDLVGLEAVGGRLVARAPGSAGLIELRGQGIFRQPALGEALIDLVVRLAPRADSAERLPPPDRCVLAGVTLPVFHLDPFTASAVARLRLLATGERVF